MGSFRSRALAAACGAGLAVATLLTSCSASAPDPDATRAVARSAAPSHHQPTATASATPNPTLLTDPESAPWGVTIVPDETILGNYTNYSYPVQVPRDGGAITYAEGTPIREGSRIVAYRVASGDIYDFIAQRFHLTNDGYLLIVNEVRRGEAAPLYAGDTLNLSASTLRKYGTVNGRVVDGPQPVAAPSQEPADPGATR